MAAADYYNTGHTADSNRYNTPVSPISTSPDFNKPLPPPHHQSTFPPTHGGGYNDDLSYAPNHYSHESVDTGYHPHSYGSHHDDSPPAKPYGDPFSDSIPLNDINQKQQHQVYPLSTAELGERPYPPPRRQKRSWGSRPWFIYFITFVQVAVFCGELARNAVLTGSPIAIKPQFNYMIGPSTDVLINMGARFVPCMREVPGFATDDPSQLYPCPNRTTLYLECSLAQWCGFDGKDIPKNLPGGKGPGSTPNQWYRFILPIFYHAGLIHLGFNMFMQITLGGDMERTVGTLRFIIVYFCSGIFGFVLGGNLGAAGQPSVGASGSLFGIFSLVLLDLFYTWKERSSPMRDFIFLTLDVVISFVLGLLPAIDNFAHIGGFLCGIVLGLVLMHSPNQLRKKICITASDPPYTQATPNNPYNISTGDNDLVGFRGFIKQPVAFFKGRKPFWWAWWLVRAGFLTLILVVFFVLLNNFYSANKKECSWCKYLSCLPVNGWCDMYDSLNVKVENNTSRMLMSRGLTGLDDFF
ncbi:hypothetical protein FN846DRAFT_931639 [Sphaerosporella brunnea]|uniref:Rhomboid-type serine protease n=1 Tax=Sphaerosporella brunnea TaxID=1250544 RepID=A0A5J5F886_9PEZI|nr:hypothetical protein FN846DRAFT_931639 [Sphaerosporella brunnea]